MRRNGVSAARPARRNMGDGRSGGAEVRGGQEGRGRRDKRGWPGEAPLAERGGAARGGGAGEEGRGRRRKGRAPGPRGRGKGRGRREVLGERRG